MNNSSILLSRQFSKGWYLLKTRLNNEIDKYHLIQNKLSISNSNNENKNKKGKINSVKSEEDKNDSYILSFTRNNVLDEERQTNKNINNNGIATHSQPIITSQTVSNINNESTTHLKNDNN